ncbi:hypothetical protein CC78DRAFT_574933 [Lojkania enalia]|uniref:Protein LOT5 n=1 Tax=Lojkania enalia TaxID=147567 RepID=A0A9P4NA20_9PLEO|nr:hypothetical protein CC78DRAFT_574933 [Didymosphaeria enalia]
MPLQLLSTAPDESDFTPVTQHQEQTPATFFGGKPILYERYSGLTLSIPSEKLQLDETIAEFAAIQDGDDAHIKGVDIWVNSEDLILFQSSPSLIGVSIPYPSIALHAIMKWKSQVEALYMNLSLNDAESLNDEDDFQILEVTVLPPNYDSIPEADCIGKIFDAMNKCADLHPDSNMSDAEDGVDGDLPTLGSGGWFTAENMHEFMDEGILAEELGPGAGTVRPREDGEEHVNGVNGGDSHETKHQRTD